MYNKQHIGIAVLGLIILVSAAWAAFEYTKERPVVFVGDPEPVTVLLGGDVNMGRLIGQKILAGEVDYPFVHIQERLKDADITFVNLESQLADLGGETQSPTNEYRFAGPPEGGKSLANAGIDVVSVANNHMWDYGRERLFETLDHLDTAGVRYVGASRKGGDAKFKSVVIEVRDIKVAFLAMTTLLNGYENSGAPEHVSYNDPLSIEKEIARLRQEDTADFILVSVHTGTEYQTQPGRETVELARRLVDSGADVIIGHHPHVPQPIERYGMDTKPIFYSLGNFAFWQPFSFWTQHSYLAKLSMGKRIDYEIIPIKAGWQPSLLTDENSVSKLTELLQETVS